MHRIALALLVVAIASACDAPWDGPAIPSGAKSIGHNGLSEFGPVAIGQGILASTHLFDLRRQVLESKTTRSFPDLPACQADTHLPDPCWMQIADGNDRLFLAVSTVATCYRTVKEAAAIKARTLFFIHWIGKPQRACNLALALPRWRLISVPRSSLPEAGKLVVDLQIQEDRSTQDLTTEADLS